MSRRNVLGRGLAALLPDPPEAPSGVLLELSINQIEPNPFQPRAQVDTPHLEDLARSLAERGVMQPILVRRAGAGFQLIAGERRWRAARLAGLGKVPALVKVVSDQEALELALVENLQREDLNPIEEAHAYQRLVAEFGLSHDHIALKVGKDRTTIANTIRLLKLPEEVQQAVSRGELSPGHARALIGLPNAQAQIGMARQSAEQRLSVRDVERRVRERIGPAEPKTQAGSPSDPNTRAAEDRLRGALGTRVRVLRKGKGGTLEISFYSEDDLNRLYDLLLRGARVSSGERGRA